MVGKLADLGKLDSGDIPDVTMGVKRLLATQSHFYTEGTTPRNSETNTRFFRMTGGAPGRAPNWFFESAITLEGSEAFDVRKYTFADHFRAAITAFRDGTPLEVPPGFVVLQPVLTIPSKQNSSICEGDTALKSELKRLSERTSQAMDFITRPLDGSASSIEMFFDDALIHNFDRRSRDWEISAYVRRIRAHGISSSEVHR